MNEDEKFDRIINDFKQATEIGMNKVKEYLSKIPIEEREKDMEEMEDSTLEFLSKDSESSEHYEICAMAKKILDKRRA